MEEPAQPAFVLPVRVYYEDTDAGGVVYYANYLRFIERARTEWLRALGFEQSRLREELGVVFAVHRVDARFRRPARLDDALRVGLHVNRISPARMVFDQAVDSAAAPRRRFFQAEVEIACLDAEDFTPRRLPHEIREAVNRWMSI